MILIRFENGHFAPRRTWFGFAWGGGNRRKHGLNLSVVTAAATALILGFAGSHAQAQVGRSASTVTAQDKQAPVMDFGPHPSEGADAIVVITPDANYELHRPLKTKRIISGRMVSNERTLVSISEGAITHAPETITAPLEKGKPVKLFLRRYPDGNDYYITAVFPADFPSEVTK